MRSQDQRASTLPRPLSFYETRDRQVTSILWLGSLHDTKATAIKTRPNPLVIFSHKNTFDTKQREPKQGYQIIQYHTK